MNFIYERDKEKVNFVLLNILAKDMVEMQLSFAEMPHKLVWKPGINDETMDTYKKILNTLSDIYTYCVKSVYNKLGFDKLYGTSMYHSRFRIDLNSSLKKNASALKFANIGKVSQVYFVFSSEDMVVIGGLLYVPSEDISYKGRLGHPSDSYTVSTVAVVPNNIIDLISLTEEEQPNLEELRSIVSSIITSSTQKMFSERKDKLYQDIEECKTELKELEEEYKNTSSIIKKCEFSLQDDVSDTDVVYCVKKREYYPGLQSPTSFKILPDTFTTQKDAFDYAESLANSEVDELNNGARQGVSFGIPEDDEYQKKSVVKVQYYYEDNTEIVTIYNIDVKSDRKE